MERNRKSQRDLRVLWKATNKFSFPSFIFLFSLIFLITASAYAVTIIISYTDEEIGGTAEDRLFLHFFNEDTGKWQEVENLERHPEQNYLKGDIPKFGWKVALVWIQSPPTTWRVGNSPNPCPGTTTLLYQVVTYSQITIKLFNIAGKEVQTTLNEPKEAGRYARSYDCNWLSNGIYIWALYSNGARVSQFNMSVVK